tara:strand:+ start:11609 stop:12355 length:747 start_codon:yes stop_codon:yes gene_type:complete
MSNTSTGLQTIPDHKVPLTKNEFKQALPKQVRGAVSDQLVNGVNQLLNDPELAENYRDNLLGYVSVLQDGKYKLTDYMNAVRYVSHKLLGDSNIQAYSKTFPDRIARFQADGKDAKAISSFVAAYNKTKLVNAIFEQTLIPTHILNADLHQKAINVQAELMMTANSEKVRCEAANSLLSHLKPPETKQVQLNVNHEVKEGSAIDELRKATEELAKQQREMIASKQMTAQQIAHSNIIEGEVEDAEFSG